MNHSSLCRIKLLNTHAASMFAKGSLVEAASAWSNSLRLVLPHVLESDPATDDDDDMMDTPHPEGNITFQHMLERPYVPSSDERVFSLFAHPFLYSIDGMSQRTYQLEDLRQIAACMVYNIALSHHLIGLPGAGKRQDLNKALMAYKAARDLLYSTTTDIRSSSESMKILALAITNNEGHVLEQLFEKDKTNHCLQQLYSILSRTYWSEESEHFHVTAVLFPRVEGLTLHAPAA